MTVPAASRRSPVYDGNDLATSFGFSFKVFASTDITVVRTNLDGSLSTLVLSSDYSVALNADQTSSPGGTVTYPISGSPLATGEKLVIVGALPYNQPLALPPGGNYNPRALENELDRQVMQIQQVADGVASSLRAPLGETLTELPDAATRANTIQAYDADGNPTVQVPTSGSAADVLIQLADTTLATRNAGLVGYDSALGYADGTVGAALKEVEASTARTTYAEQYAESGDTSNAEAFQRAIDAMDALDGGIVYTNMTAISFHQAVVLKPNVAVRGLGRGKSIITKTAHTFHGFTDNNVVADGAEVHGFTIRCATAPTTGQSDRGIFMDADSTSARYCFTDLRFENIFRGINCHQAGEVEYDNVDGSALLDSTIYIGEVAANRTGRAKMGRSRSVSSFTDNPGGGGGVIVLAYVDSISPGYSEFVNCGPAAGAVNLYHGLYPRTPGDSDFGVVKATGHKRGAPLHVFSDSGAGEAISGACAATVFSEGAANYVGVRVEYCSAFTLRSPSKISASDLQGVYLSNSGPCTIEAGVRLLNNNVSATTSAEVSAAVLVDGVSDFTAVGVVMVDDTSGAGQYGQGAGFFFKGVCPRYTVDSCQMRFPAAATGYYFINHAAGSTVTYPQITNNYTEGPQSFIDEGGTVVPAGQGIMRGNTRNSATVSPLLTVAQLHRWRVSENWNEGVRFDYESDGKNVVLWAADHPAASTWVVGDRWQRITPVAAGVPGGRCVTAGTPGTWAYEAALA